MKINRPGIFFYLFWFILWLLQAYFTELMNDEAYYWKYSSDLDWGYFDHPPVIAVIIKFGYLLFNGELGVRFGSILLSMLTIYFIERLIQPADLKLLYVIFSSILVFHVGGILAVPDVPLLFFSITFFHLYKLYLERDSWLITLLLGFNVSLLILSKYHGILIIFFTVLSDISLLKRKSFWRIAIISVLLLIPHILWQFRHDFPTLKYHFFERSTISNTLEYLITQPFILGPIIGILLLYAGFVFKPSNRFEKTLRFNFIGVYAFFLLMTIKGRVEGHWTMIATVPLLYIGYKEILKRQVMRKIVYYSFPVSLFLIFCLRIYLVWDFLPDRYKIDSEWHNSKTWAQSIDSVADHKPVIFLDSYQRASKYEFYSGKESISLNSMKKRKNQYTIWDSESGLQGKEVMIANKKHIKGFDSINTSKGQFYYTFIDNFRSFSNVRIGFAEQEIIVDTQEPVYINIKFDYINENIRDFESNADFPSYVIYQFFDGKIYYPGVITELRINNEMINNGEFYRIEIFPPADIGEYKLLVSIKTGWLPPTRNSFPIKVTRI